MSRLSRRGSRSGDGRERDRRHGRPCRVQHRKGSGSKRLYLLLRAFASQFFGFVPTFAASLRLATCVCFASFVFVRFVRCLFRSFRLAYLVRIVFLCFLAAARG